MSDLATRDDLTLLQAWRAGDRGAGNELGRRYFLVVFRFFRAKVPEVAEDLTQRTFLACVEGRGQIAGGSFRAFVFGVARKMLLRYFEGRIERMEAAGASQRSIADLRGSPSQVAMHREQLALILAAMQHIPLDFQIALELHYWEGMSHAEIAVALDIAPGTVRSRLSRAKAMVRDAVARLGAGASIDLDRATREAGDALSSMDR